MIKQIILAFLEVCFPLYSLILIEKNNMDWFAGSIGWTAYLIVYNYIYSPVMSSFVGAFMVGIYSEVMARKLKTPAMQFSIPGIFPLVPGITAYYAINSIVEQNYALAYSKGFQTIAVGGAIAFGIMLSSTTVRFITKITQTKRVK